MRTQRQSKFGAANGGGRRNRLHFQRFAAVAPPDFAAQYPQNVLQGLRGGEEEAFRGGRRDLFEFQLTVDVELDLRPAGQQGHRPAARAGAHRFPCGQRKRPRSPAASGPHAGTFHRA